MKQPDIDVVFLDEIKTHAQDIKSAHGERDANFREYEKMYLMKWEQPSRWKRVKQRPVISPDARNSLVGAVRLLVATDPIFTVRDDDDANAEEIEDIVSRIWQQSGRVSGIPLHHDQLLSAMLYAEIHASITRTEDLLSVAEDAVRNAVDERSKLYARANLERAKRLYETTPAVIENINPIGGYPEFDVFGLSAYYRESKIKINEIQNRFGYLPVQFHDKNPFDTVNLYYYCDPVYSAYWTDAAPLVLEEHKLPILPIVVQVTDGSDLFDRPEESRQPLLYTLYKSNLWSQQNLAMTVMYSLVFSIGATPIFKHVAPPTAPNKKADEVMNFDVPGGAWEMEAGEDIVPLVKNIIDPSLREVYELSLRKSEESTIYNQALGAPLQGTDTFSTIALLSQSGRLPLVGAQKRGAWGIAKTVETMLILLKDGKPYNKNRIRFSPSMYNASMTIDVKLEVKLPQDKLQQANIAQIIKTQGLASDEWIRENILQISNSNEMRRQIWTDRAKETLYQVYLQQMIQQQQQAAAQAQQMAMPPNGQEGMTPPNPEQQMQAGAMMTPGQGEMIQGIPPQMGGMMPGAGLGDVPPEEG